MQHEIPQLFQRGFLIPETGDAERVFVFRREGNVFPSNIDRSGAQSYFYSKPTLDGQRTLDDEITEYEGRLTGLVAELRALPVGANANAEVSAEVIAHLTTRNAHLRGALAHGFKGILTGAATVFGDEDNLRRLLCIDKPIISDAFRARIATALSNEPLVVALGIPPTLMERFIFAYVREGFSPLFDQQMPIFKAVFGSLVKEVTEHARDGHNEMLARSVVPDARVRRLSSLAWKVVASEYDLILPDCVALSADNEGNYQPLMMASFDDIQEVLLPLTSRTMLIGSHQIDDTKIKNVDFNTVAAACSHMYFISGFQKPELISLIELIGTQSVSVVDAAISHALSQYRPENDVDQRPTIDDQQASPLSIRIPINYHGDFDDDLINRISGELSDLLAQVAWTTPLDRLDGITFADDYAAALNNLDRGMAGMPAPEARNDEIGVGVAQCPIVVREGRVKGHVILRGLVGRMLLSDHEDQRAQAIYVIANQLAHAGVTQILDEALPGVLLTPISNPMNSDLHRFTYAGWNGYFASRASAGFGGGSLAHTQSLLRSALEDAFSVVPKQRSSYLHDKDITSLMQIALSKIAFILEQAGNLLGHAAGLDCHPLVEADELEGELRRRELLAWLADYNRDLIRLWERRGQWASYEEFLALNYHAERLLWCFGIAPWTTPEGVYRIEVSTTSDEQPLGANRPT